MDNHDFNCTYCIELAKEKKVTIKDDSKKEIAKTKELHDSVKSNESLPEELRGDQKPV